MKQKYLIIIPLSLCLKVSFAQSNGDLYSIINDSIRSKLYHFVRQESKFKVSAGMYIYNILNASSVHDNKLTNGIYKFRLMGAHLQSYYFIYTDKNGVQIIKDYSISNVITQVNKYFTEEGATLNENKKLDYMEVIINELRKRQHIPGSETLHKPAS